MFREHCDMIEDSIYHRWRYTMEEQMRFVIYSRKSKFTGKGESIENQIEMCKQYLQLHYGDEIAEQALIYEDEGFSGGNLSRPQFKKMMEDARKIKFKAIVVYRLDRISRNIGDFANLIQELNQMGIDFISIKEQFDTVSPMGRAMMYISSVFSQLERETIAERIRDNMHELSKTGRWLGGTTPLGFESESVTTVSVEGKTKKACQLRTIPEERQLVELIYDKFWETKSLTKTETYLLQNHYITRKGKPFTRFAIKAILMNPVYMVADEAAYQYLLENNVKLYAEPKAFDNIHGIMAYNRSDQPTGKAHKMKPMNEWIVAVGKHNGFIPGHRWVEVQRVLEENKSKSYRKPRSHTALLSGLLICGNCGGFMRPKANGRVLANGQPSFSYMCSVKERSRRHNCNQVNCQGNLADELVLDEIKKLSENHSQVIKMLEKSKNALKEKKLGYSGEINKLTQSINEKDEAIKNLVMVLSKTEGTVAEDYVVKQIDELHQQGEVLKHRLKELESLTAESALSDIEFDLLKQLLSVFANTVDDMTIEEKRAAIRTFVRKVVWDGTNIHIILFNSEYQYEFPETPIGLGMLGEEGLEETKTAEQKVPLREYSK